jgi:hypothetical protein
VKLIASALAVAAVGAIALTVPADAAPQKATWVRLTLVNGQ